MTDYKYDLIVIGGGGGGSACTAMANDAGYRVAQIERDRVGGTCLNYGCDPTKTMLHIGQLVDQATQAERYGLEIGKVNVDWSAVRERVVEVQNEMRGGEPEEARANLREDGIDLFMSEGSFVSDHEIEVNGERLYGKNILIATGTEPLVPDIEGLQSAGFITNREAVSLSELPNRLAVVGSGPVGTEFAQMFRRFGVDVCLFDNSPQVLPADDEELANELRDILEAEGITIYTEATLTSVEKTVDGKRLTFDYKDGEKQIDCDEVLLSLGRRPALEALNLDAAGVDVEEGKIVVDEMLRTSVPHIWAAGDIATEYPFTHTANAQSSLLAHNIFADDPKPFDNRAIPWVTYTMPELAHVGQTEQELKNLGTDYRVLRARFEDVPRAQTTGQKAGQVKLLVGANDTILGGHILGTQAGDLIAPIVLAMRNDMPVSALQDVIFPYPTMVSAIQQAADS